MHELPYTENVKSETFRLASGYFLQYETGATSHVTAAVRMKLNNRNF